MISYKSNSLPSAPPQPYIQKPALIPVILFVLSLLQQALIVMVKGPKRANRTRMQEYVIRTFRSIFSANSLNVHEALYMLLKLTGSGPFNPDDIIKTCDYNVFSFDAVLTAPGSCTDGRRTDVIHVETSLHNSYAVTLNSIWNVHAEWVTPKQSAGTNDGVILYIHGGAFIYKPPFGNRGFLALMATKFNRRILSLDYRLAPEAQFPGAVHEAVAAYMYLVNYEKVPPSKIIMMGESAGGNLAIAASLYIRNHGLPQCGGLVLISPWTDLCLNLPSIKDNEEFDLITASQRDGQENHPIHSYAGPNHKIECAREELISPVLARPLPENPKLPPIYIASGQDEVLVDDNILLAANLVHNKLSHVVVHDIYVHQIHCFQMMAPKSIDSLMCWQRVEHFINLYVDKAELLNSGNGCAVEACLIKDGVTQHQGLGDTWMWRWNGIKSTKGIKWEPNEADHCILLPSDSKVPC